MAYKKYLKRNGKRVGPYYYESYRDENGKVKKRYLGTKNPDKKVSPTKKYRKLLIILGVVLALIVVGVVILNLQVTGRVTENIDKVIVGDKIDLNIISTGVSPFPADNINKRMEFDVEGSNIRLYFDLLDYGDFVDSVEEKIVEDSEKLSVQTAGYVIRGLTGHAVLNESNISVEDIREKVEELSGDELEEIEDEVVSRAEEFDIRVENDSEEGDYKWSYKIKLNDLKFMAKVEVTAEEEMS